MLNNLTQNIKSKQSSSFNSMLFNYAQSSLRFGDPKSSTHLYSENYLSNYLILNLTIFCVASTTTHLILFTFCPSVLAVSDDVKADAMANLKKLVRNRRNVPILTLPQLKRLPDFWGWYKHFMDTHNQEGVSGICSTFIIQFLAVIIKEQCFFLLLKRNNLCPQSPKSYAGKRLNLVAF